MKHTVFPLLLSPPEDPQDKNDHFLFWFLVSRTLTQTMMPWLTTAVSLFLACSVNGLDAVLNDMCAGQADINQVACMIQKLDIKVSSQGSKLDKVIQLLQGKLDKLSSHYGQNEKRLLLYLRPSKDVFQVHCWLERTADPAPEWVNLFLRT